MDFATIGGVAGLAALIFFGVKNHQLDPSLLNMHAVFVVMGGSFVSMLINTPFKYIVKAGTELYDLLFLDETDDIKRTVPLMVALATQCRSRGLAALKDADRKHAGGFLSRVASAALEYNDSNFVKHVIELEINHGADELNEIANVYRTFSILSPMFGLLGTLIGIIGVLKQVSDPDAVGPAMGVAITSAFYGILFANMVCVPIAGKIRSRILGQIKLQSMILEGVLEIMKGSIPMVVERRLQSYLQ
ncbi:MAG TPA: MotA/TolQ/ExbB proton channel family protein [Elusimicrobiales bacterium]|nr:MotA/TolQ/ExbB proton channel family protein [Elusimicrobiales bacterium]